MNTIRENSYGIVPLRNNAATWQVLLIQHHAGHWSFPKGHAEDNETPQQAATRELYEETGLSIQHYLSAQPLIENYYFTFQGKRIAKTVEYFMALVQGKVKNQASEIQASQWLHLSEAFDYITFKEGQHLCLQVMEFLKTLDEKGNPLLV